LISSPGPSTCCGVLNDLSAEEKERYKADIRATNILLQGIPKDIYSLINHYTDAKDIWENVKMILEGSELTKDDRESQLYDEFEHFCQNKGETIQGYYVRFTKLINDMRNIKMTMPRMQLNYKLCENNMLPDNMRYMLSGSDENSTNWKGSFNYYVPLALVSNASVQQYQHVIQTSPPQPCQLEPSPADKFQLDSGSSSTENLIESLSNSLALLTQSYKSHLPQTNNQLELSDLMRNKATVHDGRRCVFKDDRLKRLQIQDYFLGQVAYYAKPRRYGAVSGTKINRCFFAGERLPTVYWGYGLSSHENGFGTHVWTLLLKLRNVMLRL
ncbi:hypothetical protein Tco_1258878, partial [Tanacetum coccineum]